MNACEMYYFSVVLPAHVYHTFTLNQQPCKFYQRVAEKPADICIYKRDLPPRVKQDFSLYHTFADGIKSA